jgi:acyl phosphate:glycerol-3-phosphate acyltransferase
MDSIAPFAGGLIAVALAYLIGSVPFAVVISRLYGLKDPRTYGSGNPGATNVLRSGRKSAALLTLLGDGAKGWLAVWLAQSASFSSGVIAAVAVAVFIGHLYPIFLGFKGGKGVATALGALLGLSGLLGLATMLTWAAVAFFFRMSSLAAIASAVFAPFYYLILSGVLWPLDKNLMLALVIISALLIYRHKANIARILKGTEPRLGQAVSGPRR